MPTKPKETVEYFPHYCLHGKSLTIFESRFPDCGYRFWFKLLETLGSKRGHFYDLQEEGSVEYLATITRVSGVNVCEMLAVCGQLGMLDKELLARDILWSYNFVDNLQPVYARRNCGLPQAPDYVDRNPDDPGLCMHPYNILGHLPRSRPEGSKGIKEVEEEREAEQRDLAPLNNKLFFPAGISYKGTELYHSILDFFTQHYPTGLPDRDRQLTAVNEIAHRSTELAGGDLTPHQVTTAMLSGLLDLKADDTSRKGFWKKMPILPSSIVTHWAQIQEHVHVGGEELAADEKTDQILDEIGF